MEYQSKELNVRIKVIGVGGGGCNAVNWMVQQGLPGVDFVVINTDNQVLNLSHAKTRVSIGNDGLGAGGNPEVGKNAAENSSDDIYNVLKDTDMVFITAGMGGGTGTGASPIVAEVARTAKILTIGVVCTPFDFEGDTRRRIAEKGLEELQKHVDAILVISNERLIEQGPEDISFESAFNLANDVLYKSVRGITELITIPGMINLDFADVCSTMRNAGTALMTVGEASGKDRATVAINQAMSSALLDATIDGARRVLYNVVYGDKSVTLAETTTIGMLIRKHVGENAQIFFGTAQDPSLGESLRITLVATDFEVSKPSPISDAFNQIVSQNTTKTTGSGDAGTTKNNSNEKYTFPLDNKNRTLPSFIRREEENKRNQS